MKHHAPIVLAVLLAAASSVFAQVPRTISFQGFIADSGGTPVTDAALGMEFVIYDDSVAGTALYTQTQPVEVTEGVFSVLLGPIAGVDFNNTHWLGITAGSISEPEMAPRTPLVSAPSAFALVLPYAAIGDTSEPVLSAKNLGMGPAIRAEGILQVKDATLGLVDADKFNERISVETTDAGLGLYSDAGGSWGSALILGEGNGGGLVDKWAIARRTSGATSAIFFTYGDGPDYSTNTRKVIVDTSGSIFVRNSYRYFQPRTGYLSVSSRAFNPSVVDSSTVWINNGIGAGFESHADSGGIANAHIQLPDGATITKLSCEIDDNDVVSNLGCRLLRHDGDEIVVMATVISSGSPGVATYETITIENNLVDNSMYAYSLQASNPNFWQNFDVQIRRVWIEYEYIEIP